MKLIDQLARDFVDKEGYFLEVAYDPERDREIDAYKAGFIQALDIIAEKFRFGTSPNSRMIYKEIRELKDKEYTENYRNPTVSAKKSSSSDEFNGA